MVISKTPVRLDFLGGLSDIKNFYSRYGGRVLNATIDKYIYVAVKRSSDKFFRVSHEKHEKAISSDKIAHSRTRAALEYFKIREPLEVVSISDVVYGGVGLGTSSAYTVGLIRALTSYTGQKLSAGKAAELACRIEIEVLGEPIGKQDQYAASWGGINLLEFDRDGGVRVRALELDKKAISKIEKYLLLIDTGITRKAKNILGAQEENFQDNIVQIKKISELAEKGSKALKRGDLREFGKILYEEWETKKATGPISTAEIERMYKKAATAGAWGGKVSGAGGGGYLMLIAPPGKHGAIKRILKGKEFIKIKFSNEGSRIIYQDNNP